MNQVIINKKVLQENIENILKKSNNLNIIAVVKGNGYGIGISEYIDILYENGIKFFGTTSIADAIAIKKSKQECKMLLIESIANKEDIDSLIQNDISITIGSVETYKNVSQVIKEKNMTCKAHILVDTGFGITGLKKNELETILNENDNQKIKIEGIYSHVTNSFGKEEDSKKQLSIFKEYLEIADKYNVKPEYVHICNSHAFLRFPDMHFNTVRLGSLFVGIISYRYKENFKAVASLKTKIIDVKSIENGTVIGYGGAKKVKKRTNVAIIPVGYYDGIFVSFKRDTYKIADVLRIIKDTILSYTKKHIGYVYINEKRYSVILLSDMNHTAIDVGNDVGNVGDEVIIKGINPLYIKNEIERKFM